MNNGEEFGLGSAGSKSKTRMRLSISIGSLTYPVTCPLKCPTQQAILSALPLPFRPLNFLSLLYPDYLS